MPKTKHKDIVDYWLPLKDECELGVDWSEAHERCWRCGYKSSLHRCHIVPDSLEGVDHPSNLILLCGRCHREAPNHTNPQYMWIWLKASYGSFYDTYWTQRGLEEFERMFQRKPFSNLNEKQVDLNEINELLGREIEKTTIHFGEGRLNPSTIACVIAELEKKLTSMYEV